MRRPTTTELGYALLLSVPPGLGATAFALHLVGLAPIILVYGGLLTVVLFLVLLVIFTTGEPARADAALGQP